MHTVHLNSIKFTLIFEQERVIYNLITKCSTNSIPLCAPQRKDKQIDRQRYCSICMEMMQLSCVFDFNTYPWNVQKKIIHMYID